jgi:GNAT superfamily N-acetyltransferase
MNEVEAQTAPIRVRTGTPADIHPMMGLALAACEENGLTDPNPQKLATEIWAGLTFQHGIVGIIGESSPLEAAILLRVESMWYSDAPALIERAIFVHPEYRAAKGGRARLLCEFAKNAARELNMKLVIGVLSTHRTEAKSRLYSRQFGEPAGSYWFYDGAGAQG